MKKLIFLMAVIVIALACSGCQPPPESVDDKFTSFTLPVYHPLVTQYDSLKQERNVAKALFALGRVHKINEQIDLVAHTTGRLSVLVEKAQAGDCIAKAQLQSLQKAISVYERDDFDRQVVKDHLEENNIVPCE
jgi:PBP1b-binding outer membrane lipoprotein LpoB